MSLKEEYQRYLAAEQEYLVKKGVYDAKLAEIKDKTQAALASESLELLNILGVDFEVDLGKLNNNEYCSSKIREIEGILDKIEDYGMKLLA
jgi:hypothetical protein